MSLCQTFRELSYQTWIQLGKARQAKHQMLEESITDSLMVELKLRHPYDVMTTTFTRHEEGKNGADWEWWFVDSTGTKGIGFRVQAKIINFKTNAFESLHYLKKNGKYQTDVLVDAARKSSRPLIPLYCLYLHSNCLPTPWTVQLLNLLGIHAGDARLNCYSEHYACSLLSVHAVKKFKINKINELVDIIDDLYPWHLLICQSDLHESQNTLMNRVTAFVERYNLTPSADIDTVYYGELPTYVQNMINNYGGDFYLDKDSANDELGRDLQGIMIIKDNEGID